MRRQMILAAIMTLLLFVFAFAASAETEGYDENTEVLVKGAVKEISSGGHGPVIVKIANSKSYNIITAPVWYIRTRSINFQIDSNIEVTGSKYFGRDGQLYVIARKIRDTATGKEVFLRDDQCKPMWHGMRHR